MCVLNIIALVMYASPEQRQIYSDGQQFHQYQQNEQSLLTWNHWTWKKTTTYDVRNPGPGLGQAQNVAGLNRLMVSPTNYQIDTTCENYLESK